MNDRSGASVRVRGIVQGVGFRPFVYGLATKLGLLGWIRNTSGGVELELDGSPQCLEEFYRKLRDEAPPLASIDQLQVQTRPPNGFTEFIIKRSEQTGETFQPISPDVSLCADCLKEMLDPADRRYRYPFINCTNCGPRFTIIQGMPYDRPKTTMAPFEMCAACWAEYENPLDRRFHAQPVACPECGPHVWLAGAQDPIQEGRRLLAEGKIVAVKGLGGFHLACDASNAEAVKELRRRKGRPAKPFAVMMPDLETVRQHCELEPDEEDWLVRRERPILILRRRADSPLAAELAPGQDSIGVMLPYTPLHVLLTEPQAGFPRTLVMTSGNATDQPIEIHNDSAQENLDPFADAFLLHNRDIHIGCDDSVVRVTQGELYPIRRSRGFAPSPIQLGWESAPILAVGGELKNTFCLTRGRRAILSQHLGDLENFEALRAFEHSIAHFERALGVQPELLAMDNHPDYLATQYAQARAKREGIPLVGVQHHHAHIVSCMAEHGLDPEEQVIGVAFDGTGYGADGTIWGGEFLLSTMADFERSCHLRPVPLLGGEAAVRNPWRQALVWLQDSDLEWRSDLPPVMGRDPNELELLSQQLAGRINAPMTSSAGRLFDAASALIGICQSVTYEGQAAIELEAAADPQEGGSYAFEVYQGELDPRPGFGAIADDLRGGVAAPVIAARFHNGLARAVAHVAGQIRAESGVNRVVLSGGVWQNMLLLGRTLEALKAAEFEIRFHRLIPCNDGGIALGQAAVAQFQREQG